MIFVVKFFVICILFFVTYININSQNEVDSIQVHNETFYSGLTPLDTVYSITKLVRAIDAVIANNSKNLGYTKYGIGVYSLNQNKYYYKRNTKELLTPASTTKLFTTYLLYRQNGKNFNIPTEVYHDGKIAADGTLNGNLYIRGKGDALFSLSDLEILADKVRKFGIKRITGNIIADGTFYDEKTERIIYSGDKDVVQATPPITALNIDRNAATIIVKGANKPGAAPDVQVIPSSDSHIIINNAKIGNPGRRNAIRINTKMQPDGKQQFIVSGVIKPNTTFAYKHLIHNPPLTIAGAFKNRLSAGGIVINGGIGVLHHNLNDSLRKSYQYVTDFKRPAVEIVNIVNKDSDNYLAEILFKMVGATQGNFIDNAGATRSFADSIFTLDEIPCSGCKLNDGSGLSRRNLVTIESLLKILSNSFNYEFAEDYINSMSIASIDGTLRKRMKNTTAEGNAKAKTGTLRNVSALAGYIRTMDGEDLAFAFVFNGPNVGAYKLIENELCCVLSEFYIEEVR